MKVTTHPRIKCTKAELSSVYCLSDLLDFLEDIEVLEAFEESKEEKIKTELENKKRKEEALKKRG